MVTLIDIGLAFLIALAGLVTAMAIALRIYDVNPVGQQTDIRN